MITALLMTAFLWAGEMVDGHVHKAPHGGKIAHIGDHQHVELRVDETEVVVWILDENARPLSPKGRSLRLTITPKDRPKQTVVMTARDDHFRGAVELLGLPELQVTAELKFGRQTAQTSFRWTILDAPERIQDSDPYDGLKL